MQIDRRAFLGAAASGLGAALLNAACGDENAQNSSQLINGLKEVKVHRIPQELGPRQTPEQVYEASRILSRDYLNLREQYTAEDLASAARSITSRQIKLMRSYDPSLKIEEERETVRAYDLGFSVAMNSKDFLVGATIIDVFFQTTFAGELQSYDRSFEDNKQKVKNGDNVLWVINNIPIEVRDGPSIARAQDLEEFSIIIQSLQEAGIPTPKAAIVKTAAADEIRPPKIVLGAFSTAFDEFGISTPIANYLIALDPAIYSNHNREVTTAYDQRTQDLKDPRLMFSTDYKPGEYKPAAGAEEFGQTLRDYVMRGEEFRKRIAFAKAAGFITEARVLEARYDSIMNLFQGREFTKDGKEKMGNSIKIGDTRRIDNWEPEKPEIFLRPVPTLAINYGWSHIYDDFVVKITDGPVTIPDYVAKQATTFYKVTHVGIIDASGQFKQIGAFASGWVPQAWFGEVVK